MLSPLDDYPVHQISEPMRFVGTVRSQLLRPLLLQHPWHRRHPGHRRGAVLRHRSGPVPEPGRRRCLRLGALGRRPPGGACLQGTRRRPHGRVGRSHQGRGPKGPRAHPDRPRAQRVGCRARRRLRGILRGPPRVAPLRPAVQPGHLRLDAVRPGRRVAGPPARRRSHRRPHARPVVGVAGPVVGGASGGRARAAGHPGHRRR